MVRKSPPKSAKSGKSGKPGRTGKPPFRARPKFASRIVDEEEGSEPEEQELAPPARQEAVVETFQQLWAKLFSEPVHLDSALSKLPPRAKSVLAQILPSILLRPASQAEAYGIGVAEGEPWNLSASELGHWSAARQLCERLYTAMSGKPTAATPVRDDFPPAMIRELEDTFGKDVAEELVQVLGTEAPLSLRASRSIGARGLLDGLKKGSRIPVAMSVSDLSPLGVRLSGYAPVLGTEWYERGQFEIQDEGSQVMALFALWPERFAPLLQDKPGLALKNAPKQNPPWLAPLPEEVPAWTVVDACAGAGGKSLAFADALKGKGRIFAYDTSEKKLQALRRRARRAGFNSIQAVALQEGHEAEVISKFRRRANIVLVDAPCTGWGVLRRNPDIKWRQTPEARDRMPEIQLRLLTQYSELVASGGRLVFGVCTFRKAETRDVVERFLAANPSFKALEGGFVGPGPCDGFFMQRFERVSK